MIDFTPLANLALFGFACACIVLGAVAGAVFGLPFAIWQHNIADLTIPAICGAAAGLGFAIWIVIASGAIGRS